MKKGTAFLIPVIGIAGWKNSGKTTMTVRLVEEFTRRGLRLATVKHAHHAFQVDDGEADSARHRRAGAQQVAVVSDARWAVIRELGSEHEPSLAEVISWLDPCDLVIVEGYKSAAIPKIELRRTASLTHLELAPADPDVVAIAADHPVADAKVPVFSLDDISGIADRIDQVVGPLGASEAANSTTSERP